MNTPSKPLAFVEAARNAAAKSPIQALRDEGASIATVLRHSGGRPIGLVFDLGRASDALIADIEAAMAAPPRDTIEEAEGRLADLRAGRTRAHPLAVLDRIEAGEHPIKVFREIRGLTQKQLAKNERVGSSAEYIGQIERGTRSPSRALANGIAWALCVHPADLDPETYR
jgi:DNA-binding XRE family transcriptional regulator